MRRLYIFAQIDEAGRARLIEENPDCQINFHEDIDEKQRKSVFLQSDIVFGNPPPEWVEEAAQLEWMQLSSAGFDPYQHIKTKAVITNLKGFYSWPCAETAIAGIMSLYRKIDTLTLLKQERCWIGTPLRYEMSLLRGQNVVILGAGGIAQVCGQILRGFDCQVTFFARTAPEAKLRTAEDLKKILPETDVVINCLPGTKETTGFFTADMINSMKPTAVFVNVGRGSTVDEPALIKVLQERRIGGAVLDVHWLEPLPEDHPLWSLENTVLTQHTGGGIRDEFAGRLDVFRGNLKRYKKGQPLENIVDLGRGY